MCSVHHDCNVDHHHLPGEHVKVELFWSSDANVSPVDLPRFLFSLLWGRLPISGDHCHDFGDHDLDDDLQQC